MVALFPDEELWLCRWLRAAMIPHLVGLGVSSLVVGNRLRVDANEAPVDPWTVGVHSDGGPSESPVSKVISVRFDVTGPDSDPSGVATARLARVIEAVVRSMPVADPGCPFAAVRAIRGPYDVPGGSRPRFLLTADLVLVGEPFQP